MACNSDLTVKHILIECGEFAEDRQRYEAENLQQLFQGTSVTDIFNFLWKIGLLYRLQELLVYDYL